MTRGIRRTITIVAAVCAGTIAYGALLRAQSVPVRDVVTSGVRSAVSFGNVFGVRALAGGGVLVNDGTRRQLVKLDATLASPTIVIDSIAGGGNSYGSRAAPLIPYLADSSLFVDGASLSLLVIDPTGTVTRVMAAPKPGDLRFLAAGASGVDRDGNLLYRSMLPSFRGPSRTTGAPSAGAPSPLQPADSAPILRANFETRVVDTIGRVGAQSGARSTMRPGEDGRMSMTTVVNPLPTVDEWAVLSDGSVAFVRGHDYHIDWIRPDGTRFSSAKLPFDWKRLTDADKQALIDSARVARERSPVAGAPGASGGAGAGSAASNAASAAERMMATLGGSGGGGGGGLSVGSGAPGGTVAVSSAKTEFVPLADIADYYPPIRPGATRPDLDGNLWILPTTSAQSKAGELVYDVVSNAGVLVQRVRMPAGRSIAGFGHDGVVYLMHRDAENRWWLERATIGTPTPAGRPSR